MSADEPSHVPDATELLFMPKEALFSAISEIEAGTPMARSLARLLHALAACLTGERLGADGKRMQFWPPEEEADKAPRRAVDFLELADRLDGIGLAAGGHKESL